MLKKQIIGGLAVLLLAAGGFVTAQAVTPQEGAEVVGEENSSLDQLPVDQGQEETDPSATYSSDLAATYQDEQGLTLPASMDKIAIQAANDFLAEKGSQADAVFKSYTEENLADDTVYTVAYTSVSSGRMIRVIIDGMTGDVSQVS